MAYNKHTLRKPWAWRDCPIYYGSSLEWIKDKYEFPFYWYRQIDKNIELVKQISRFCGVVQDWNEWVEVIPKPENDIPEVRPPDENYLDRREWNTLGAYVKDPLPRQMTIEHGTTKKIYELTEDGRYKSITYFKDGKIVYQCNMEYKKFENHLYPVHYYSSEKREVKRVGAHWQWISGRPYTEKKQFYGKRK
jgi:predicted transcriptional regulator